ncbi:unnamed protein product [Ascophyllum nodosum]
METIGKAGGRLSLVRPSSAPEVDYEGARTPEEKACRVLDEIRQGAEFWDMRARVQRHVSSAEATERHREPEREIVRAMKELGCHDELRNVILEAHAKGVRRQEAGRGTLPAELRFLYPELYTPSPSRTSFRTSSAATGGGGVSQSDDPEPLDHVRKACLRWRANVADELRALAEEKGGKLARRRSKGARMGGAGGDEGDQPGAIPDSSLSGGVEGSRGRGKSDSAAGDEGGTDGFLFDSADLLDAVSAIRSPNRSEFLPVEGEWGMVQLQLHTPSLEDLQHSYRELSPDLHQAGLDDRGGFGEERFSGERLSQGRKVLQSCDKLEAMEYARRGITDSLRPAVWRLMLGLPKAITREDREYFRGLMSRVDRMELVTDELYSLDVQFISDDDKYFPFEDTLHDVIMAFSRDAWILRHSDVILHDLVPIGDADVDGEAMALGGGGFCPPCGVQPFRGLVNYAAVLCFLFEEREAVYFAMRAMFARYWCRLNALRSGPGMLLRLLRLFECLVQQHHPQLVLKLRQLGVQPLQLAMPWIQFGFVTFLEADQVLLLWDRLLGYDSLELLPVLAAAVLVFRADLIMQVSDAATAMNIFSDGRQLEVVPLLQAFLFPAW